MNSKELKRIELVEYETIRYPESEISEEFWDDDMAELRQPDLDR